MITRPTRITVLDIISTDLQSAIILKTLMMITVMIIIEFIFGYCRVDHSDGGGTIPRVIIGLAGGGGDGGGGVRGIKMLIIRSVIERASDEIRVKADRERGVGWECVGVAEVCSVAEDL